MDHQHMINIILLVGLLLTLIIMAVALHKNKLWPFRKPKDEDKAMHALSGESPANVSPGVAGTIVIIIIVIVIVGVAILGVYMTLMRYKLAASAIKSGNTGVAVAALSPEIGSGIGSIFGRNN